MIAVVNGTKSQKLVDKFDSRDVKKYMFCIVKQMAKPCHDTQTANCLRNIKMHMMISSNCAYTLVTL